MSNLTSRLPTPPPYLYCLVDTSYGTAKLPIIVAQALAGGAKIFQLRAKNLAEETIVELGQAIKQQLKAASSDNLLIINDHPQLAQQIAADGVHLGAEDISPHLARQILGKHAIIGATLHNIKEANAIDYDMIDYVGIGPVFTSVTKNDLPPLNPHLSPKGLSSIINSVRFHSDCPIICIGGIEQSNMHQLQEYNIDGLALAGAIANPATTMNVCQNMIAQLGSWK